MTRDNEKFIEYWKCLNQSAKLIKRKNLSKKDKIKINNLYEKADKLLLEINEKNLKPSYSTTGIIVGSISAAAITGALLYYFNKKNLEKNVVDFSNLDTGSRIKIDDNEYTFLKYISDTKSILYTKDNNIIDKNIFEFKDMLGENDQDNSYNPDTYYKNKDNDYYLFIKSVNGAGLGQEISYIVCNLLNTDGHNFEIIN